MRFGATGRIPIHRPLADITFSYTHAWGKARVNSTKRVDPNPATSRELAIAYAEKVSTRQTFQD